MSIFGIELGFLYPYLLAGIPVALGGLVYAYRKRGRGERVLVASTLLLELLERSSSARRKFKPPARFWLELLLLLLLVLAASGLYRKNSGSRIALVLDNSFSMRALDLADPSVRPRFEVAKSEAVRLLRGLGSSSSVTVFLTSPLLHSIADAPATPSAAETQISSAESVFAGDNLDAALTRLSHDERFDQIEVLTDRPAAKVAGGASPSRIHLAQISPDASGPAAGNVSVADLRLEQNALNAGELALEATVANYGDQPQKVAAALEGLSSAGGTWTALREISQDVPPHASAAVRFERVPQQIGALRVTIHPASGGSRVDAIQDDDRAWITPSAEGEHLLLVSQFSPAELNLKQLKGVSFDYLTPSQYSSEELRKLAPRAVIFHRAAPKSLPEANSLFILPPQGNPLFEVRAEATAPQVTRWSSSHPLLSYLNLSVLALPKVSPVQPPPWAEALVSTTAGPVLFAGELGDRRYAALGFDLFPYEGKKAPVVSILTLNFIKWLAELSVHEGYRTVFSALRLEPAITRAAFDDGAALPIPPGDRREIMVEHPGLVRLSSGTGESYVAVNFFNAEESDAARRAAVELPPETPRMSDGKQDSAFTRDLARFALLLLALDLLVSLLRPLVRKGAAA